MPRTPSTQIDLALAVLDVIRPPGVPIPGRIIADICGCSYNNIYMIERRAIDKIKAGLADHADLLGEDALERPAQTISHHLNGVIA